MPDWPIAFWLMFNHLFVVLIFNVFLPKNDCLVAWNGLEPFGAVWTPAEMSEISTLHRPTRPQPNVVEKAQDKGHMGQGSVLHTRTPFLNICLVQVGQHWATQKKIAGRLNNKRYLKTQRLNMSLNFGYSKHEMHVGTPWILQFFFSTGTHQLFTGKHHG